MKANNKLVVILLTLFVVSGNIFSQNTILELLNKRDSLRDSLYIQNQKHEADLLVKSSILTEVDLETSPQPMIREYKESSDAYSLMSPITQVEPSMNIDTTNSINISKGLNLRGKQAQFADEFSFLLLNKNGQNLFVDYGVDIAKRNNIILSPNAYALSVNTRGISIIGYDENGTRRGIQALKKLLSSSMVKGSDFSYVRIVSN